jgi:hypothetical protein
VQAFLSLIFPASRLVSVQTLFRSVLFSVVLQGRFPRRNILHIPIRAPPNPNPKRKKYLRPLSPTTIDQGRLSCRDRPSPPILRPHPHPHPNPPYILPALSQINGLVGTEPQKVEGSTKRSHVPALAFSLRPIDTTTSSRSSSTLDASLSNPDSTGSEQTKCRPPVTMPTTSSCCHTMAPRPRAPIRARSTSTCGISLET